MAIDFVKGWSVIGSPPLAASIGVFLRYLWVWDGETYILACRLPFRHFSPVSSQFGHKIGRKIVLVTLLSSMLFMAECFDSPDGGACILAADHGP